VAELANPAAEKVLWASYGDAPNSWFFSYRVQGGQTVVRLGDGLPSALRDYINRIKESSKDLFSMVRVQLGAHGSFVVWAGTAWACYNVPAPLLERLLAKSSGTRASNGMTLGSIKSSFITNVQWHSDGSFYLRTSSNAHAWYFASSTVRRAWKDLWNDGDAMLTPGHLAELAVSKLRLLQCHC
jgi:methylenetetrahydrofolate dehydrogenase (NADP+)/methenyltetrahydrofolate cyclohydrolase/formyltetrahydrofolate synthetase